MAKKKAPLSAIQIAANVARAAHEKAVEAHEKAASPANAKAVLDTKTAMDHAVHAENRERFERIGGTRVGKVISGLENVSKLAKPRSYAFTEADIVKIETAVHAAAVAAITELRNASKPKNTAQASAFKF